MEPIGIVGATANILGTTLSSALLLYTILEQASENIKEARDILINDVSSAVRILERIQTEGRPDDVCGHMSQDLSVRCGKTRSIQKIVHTVHNQSCMQQD